MKRILFCLMVLLLAAAPARAALLTGTPVFTQPVFSQLGPIVLNTLTITPLANGFSVSGQVGIQVPAGSASGTLASWEVEYPIDPLYPFNPALFTTTSLLGFSAPPVGIVGNTSGVVESSIVTLPNTVLAPSISNVPMSLVAGVDSPLWNPALVGNSTLFPFAGAPNMVLRQRFDLDGVYSSGPGGTWIIDVPVTSFVTVPEPSSFSLLGIGLSAAGVYKFRRRKAC